MYKVRKFGDPQLTKYWPNLTLKAYADGTMPSTFMFAPLIVEQQPGVFAPEADGLTQWLKIPRSEMLKMAALQEPDDDGMGNPMTYENKMSWIVDLRVFDQGSDGRPGQPFWSPLEFRDMGYQWDTLPWAKFGTIVFGDNIVEVIDETVQPIFLPGLGRTENVKLYKIRGFSPADWDKDWRDYPQLFHRVTCAYTRNTDTGKLYDILGDTPAGFVVCPNWGVDYKFIGQYKAAGLWIIADWVYPV